MRQAKLNVLHWRKQLGYIPFYRLAELNGGH